MTDEHSKVVTFVSFKGGAGRSVALGNVAYQLAKRYRVGCVDFDIEAGGLHKVFDVGDPGKDSLQHFLMDEEDLAECLQCDEIPDYSEPETFRRHLVIDVVDDSTSYLSKDPAIHGGIYLIQAQPDADLTGRVDSGMNMLFRFNKLIKIFSRTMDLDYLLVDSRSGISNLGLPGLAYCELALVFLKWGTQHRYGTEAFLRWYQSWLRDANMQKKILLVPSAIDQLRVSEGDIQTFISDNLVQEPDGWMTIPLVGALDGRDFVLSDAESKNDAEPFSLLAERIEGMMG